MEELSERLEGLDRPLADLDVTPGGQVFAITEKGRGKEEKGQIFVNGQPLPVPAPICYPVLRALAVTYFDEAYASRDGLGAVLRSHLL